MYAQWLTLKMIHYIVRIQIQWRFLSKYMFDQLYILLGTDDIYVSFSWVKE